MTAEDYELLVSTRAIVSEVSERLGELLDGWYAEYLGCDEDETVADHINGGNRLVLNDRGTEPPDVILYRRLRFLLGRLDKVVRCSACDNTGYVGGDELAGDPPDPCPSCAKGEG